MSTNNAINNSTKITQFTTDGTWTKDPRSQLVTLIMWGGGGGGGSGRQGASGSASGGGGGAHGGFVKSIIPSSFCGATETVTVGQGGGGGVAQSSANTDGNDGTHGTPSTFGNLTTLDNYDVTLSNQGSGGNATYGGKGLQPQCFIHQSIMYETCDSGAGSNITGADAQSTGCLYDNEGTGFTAGGGGGGGGANSGTAYAGGTGSGIYNSTGSSSPVLAGAAGGIETGTIDGTNGSNYQTSGGIMTGGLGGGGGGGQKAGAVAGNGGNGGFPGGGGGGGGGSLNGTNSGAGGDGGDGLVIVIEHF